MASESDELAAALSGLPLETQKQAVRMLDEWSVGPRGQDSFPIRMALISRLMLWCHARLTATMLKERVAIGSVAHDVLMAITRQQEVQEAFGRDFRSAAAGQSERILSQAHSLERAQTVLLERLVTIQEVLPTPEQISRAMRSAPNPTAPHDESDDCTAHLELGSLLGHLSQLVNRMEAAGSSTAPMEPQETVLSQPPPTPFVDLRRRRAVTFLLGTILLQFCSLACTGAWSFPTATGAVFVALLLTILFLLLLPPTVVVPT